MDYPRASQDYSQHFIHPRLDKPDQLTPQVGLFQGDFGIQFEGPDSEHHFGNQRSGDTVGRNTHTLSRRIKDGMDLFLQGRYDANSNHIVGRARYDANMLSDVRTALAFSHDFRPIAISYMQTYIRGWDEACEAVSLLAAPPVPVSSLFALGERHVSAPADFTALQQHGELLLVCGLPGLPEYGQGREKMQIVIKVSCLSCLSICWLSCLSAVCLLSTVCLP
jgi:hypothetical protein